MKKLIRNTLTALAIGAKSLAPGGDAMGQETNDPISGGPTAEIYAPTVNYEASAEFKITNLIKLGNFGYVHANAGIIGVPIRSKAINLTNYFPGEEGLSPLSSASFGTGLDINLGKRTKLGLDLDIRLNKNGFSGGRTSFTLKHNLKHFGLPNVNAYIKYKNTSWMIHFPNSSPIFYERESLGLGAEYEKQIAENLKINVGAGFSHRSINRESYQIGKASPLKFHTDIGLHYKIPPIKFGRLNLGSEIEPTPPPTPKPKAQKSTSQKRKVSNTVPCYAYPQHRGTESKIFNRPNEPMR